MGLPNNARLLLLGLVLGISSVVLRPYISSTGIVMASHWLSTSHYHHRAPHMPNHDPFDVDEPRDEKLRRLASTKDGGREKEERRVALEELAEVERRAQSAGHENKSGHERGEWPLWLVLDDMRKSTAWPALSRRVETLQPPQVVLLYSTPLPNVVLPRPQPHTFLSNLTIALSREGFLPVSPHPSTSTKPRLTLSKTPVIELGIPSNLSVTDAERLAFALQPFRTRASFVAFSRSLRSSRPAAKKTTRSRQLKLHQALGHHSGHPRVNSLRQWVGGEGEAEVEGVVWTAVALAGESEGEELVRREYGELEGQGRAWRFGDEPIGVF